MADALKQSGGGLKLLPGALQVLVGPERQAKPVPQLGLLLGLVDLLGNVEPLLQVADGLADVPVQILNTTCNTTL